MSTVKENSNNYNNYWKHYPYGTEAWWAGKNTAEEEDPPAPERAFIDPTPLRCTDWEQQPVGEDQMFRLLIAPEAHKEKSLDQIVHDPAIPLLCITGSLYAEIRYVVLKNPTLECAMFLTLKRLNPNRPQWLATDFFMPGQKVSSGGVNLDGPDCEKYFEAVKNATPYYQEHGLHRNLCHLHSHASFGTFWSSTDDHQQLSREDLGFMDDYRLYVVVNAAGSIKASLVLYKPVLFRMDAAVALYYGGEGAATPLSKARKAALDEIVKNALQVTTAVTSEHAVTATTAAASDKQSIAVPSVRLGYGIPKTVWPRKGSLYDSRTTPYASRVKYADTSPDAYPDACAVQEFDDILPGGNEWAAFVMEPALEAFIKGFQKDPEVAKLLLPEDAGSYDYWMKELCKTMCSALLDFVDGDEVYSPLMSTVALGLSDKNVYNGEAMRWLGDYMRQIVHYYWQLNNGVVVELPDTELVGFAAVRDYLKKRGAQKVMDTWGTPEDNDATFELSAMLQDELCSDISQTLLAMASSEA